MKISERIQKSLNLSKKFIGEFDDEMLATFKEHTSTYNADVERSAFCLLGDAIKAGFINQDEYDWFKLIYSSPKKFRNLPPEMQLFFVEFTGFIIGHFIKKPKSTDGKIIEALAKALTDALDEIRKIIEREKGDKIEI